MILTWITDSFECQTQLNTELVCIYIFDLIFYIFLTGGTAGVAWHRITFQPPLPPNNILKEFLQRNFYRMFILENLQKFNRWNLACGI